MEPGSSTDAACTDRDRGVDAEGGGDADEVTITRVGVAATG